jgi:hypothetical protein
MNDRFLAGAWRDRLWRDLLWKTNVNPYATKMPIRLKDIDIPSWSWASVDGPVLYHFSDENRSTFHAKQLMELISARESDGGHICLNLRARMVKYLYRKNDDLGLIRLRHPTHTPTVSAEFSPDTDETGLDEVWVFQVAESHYYDHCIAMVDIGQISNTIQFRRVGYVGVSKQHSQSDFGGTPMTTFSPI